MAKNNETFKRGDLRDKDQFKIDDKFLNEYAKYVGIYAVGVYASLCKHAQFKFQKTFPLVKKIAEELDISLSKVLYSLWVLESFNIIKRHENRYDLIHKKYWKNPKLIN